MNLMDICGLIGGALMVWWSVTLLNFSMKYDREDTSKRISAVVMVVCSFVVMILYVCNVLSNVL